MPPRPSSPRISYPGTGWSEAAAAEHGGRGLAPNFYAIYLEEESRVAAPPHINLIALYARAGESAKAKQHFEAATALNANRPDAWYDYGVLLFGQRDYPAAEQAFRRALSINPQYAEAHNNLGAIYEQQGKLDDAAKEFRDAIAERPDYPLARFHLARILVNRENYDEAIQQLQRAIEPATDQTPVYLYALGAAYARAGKRTEAVAYLRKARDAAGALGQAQLLASIDRDLKSLAGEP